MCLPPLHISEFANLCSKICPFLVFQVCSGQLEMEASSDLIDSLKIELDELRTAINASALKPLSGETYEGASMQLSASTNSVSSSIEVNILVLNKKNCKPYFPYSLIEIVANSCEPK